MNRNTIYESDIEEAALGWFDELGYTVLHGPDIAPDTPDAERSSYNEVVLTRRLQNAVANLNPNIPADAQQEAIRKILNPDSQKRMSYKGVHLQVCWNVQFAHTRAGQLRQHR